MSPTTADADVVMNVLRVILFVGALSALVHILVTPNPFWWQRAKAADTNTIVDLATQVNQLTIAEFVAWPAVPGAPHRAGDLIRFAPPRPNYGRFPTGVPSTPPPAGPNGPPYGLGLGRRTGTLMKPATPAVLRDIAHNVLSHLAHTEEEGQLPWFLYTDPQRLRLLADLMEKPFVGPSSGDVIARFLETLSRSLDADHGRGLTTVISPDEARSIHAAILKEGAENAEALTSAGLAAVRSEDRATEMAGLVDDQAKLISSLRAAVLRLTDLLKRAADDERVEVSFVFVPSNGAPTDAQGMGVEEAMDLALAMDTVK